MTEQWTLHEQRQYAWEYFKTHAQQRMSLFNFFVVFSSLATTGLASTFQKEIKAHFVGMGFGFLLVLVSYVFWKLDERVGVLIKHSEKALMLVEDRLDPSDAVEKTCFGLFTTEAMRTERKRKLPWYRPCQKHLTYSVCFRLTFGVFFFVGLIGIVSSCYLQGRHQSQSPTSPATEQTVTMDSSLRAEVSELAGDQ